MTVYAQASNKYGILISSEVHLVVCGFSALALGLSLIFPKTDFHSLVSFTRAVVSWIFEIDPQSNESPETNLPLSPE